MPSLVALALLATIGALHYGLPDLPFDLPITSEPVTADASITGRASVIDGDTIEIHGERIRILDIDAPESDQLCFETRGIDPRHWYCGRVAAIKLADWIGARTVVCGTTRKDRYKRWLARCTVAGDDLGQWMADHGWVVPYRDCKCEIIRSAADRARAAQLGIWAGEFQMPWDWRKAH